jgi:hypothetical protein
MAGKAVVYTDQKNHQKGVYMLKIAIPDAPEYVLGEVASDTEIGGVARCVVSGPNLPANGFPEMGHRITDEDDVDAVAWPHAVEGGVTSQPPIIIIECP